VETVIANLTGAARRVTWQGRDYLVAPVSLLVPGVLAGSRGPLLYRPEDVSRDPAAWNHMPIVAGHPEQDGRHVSARDPDVLEKYEIGRVYRARANGKLTGEAWIDVAAARRLAPRVLAALAAGTPVEVSTGLYTDPEPAPAGAAHNGVSYTHVARDLRPDHLAVLLDSVGACSIQDGCGLNVHARGESMTLLERFISWLTGHARVTNQPSAELDITAEKACQILRDGEVNGHPLTEAQKGMFGAKCGEARNEGVTMNCQQQTNRAARNQEEGGETTGVDIKALADLFGITTDPGTDPAAFIAELKAKLDEVSARLGVAEPAPPPMEELPVASARLTAQEREDLAFARAERTRQQQALIGRLTEHAADADARRAAAAVYGGLTLAQLHQLAAALPEPAEPAPAAAQPAHWLGAAGVAPALPATHEPLPQPAVNWGAWRKR
jgi:hypothetical protein